MTLARVPVDGAELCVDALGDPSDPAVLLLMGAAASMDRWEDGFCERLVAAGRYVVRYDNRDTGDSTSWPPGEPGYTGDALTADALAILDQLGIARAHLVGMSMGGGIAQDIAVRHPDRVLSLTLMSTSPAGPGGPGDEDLPGMSDEMEALFSGADAPPEPDWDDRDAAVAYLLEAERPFAGPGGIDEAHMRALIGRVYDRSRSMPSGNNHFMLADGSGGIARDDLARIAVPALVVHGTEDPLFPPAHGEALAREIPRARLLLVPGLGHEFTPAAWDTVIPAIVALTA